jgi:hypothetical protein
VNSIIVKPRFKYLWKFSEDLACAEIDKMYCFIDRTGKIVIPPIFDSSEDFHGGVAQAELNGRSCLIDSKGSVIFMCANENEGGDHLSKEELGDFYNDVALVSGRFLAPLSDCSHDHPGCNGVCVDDPCSCSRASLICERCSTDYGYYIDAAGKPIPMPEGIVGIGDFSEGLGLVGKPVFNSETGQMSYKYGYIDNRGVVTIAPTFDSADDFADGKARVYTDQEEWRLIDKEGNFMDAAGSEDSNSEERDMTVQDGLKRIEAAGFYGFADERGNVVIEPRFAWVGYFSNGMARFKTSRLSDAKWGFIDRTGKTVNPPKFDDAQDFEAEPV